MKSTTKWLGLLGAAALALPVFAGGAKLLRGETGKTLSDCCCKEVDGKIVCQETGKALAECCCIKQ
ncbi:MAG: hypothetical protein L0Y58_17240 [Verrucomicrobia subdivision 3 bacterium]|nr:hypothetical protein [Limisphaerales bacterium]